MASQFIDEFKATYAERFSDASFLRPLELWAFYRFVRRVHRHMGELDARLEQLAKERDDALLQLGQQMLGRHNENSITGSYRFEQTLQNIDDQRAQLLETVQTLEHQITQLRSRTAALIREKDSQLSALKTEDAFLNTEIEALGRSETAADKRTVLEAQLKENQRSQRDIRTERARLRDEGLLEFENLNQQLRAQLDQVERTSSRSNTVKRDLGRAVLASGRFESHANEVALSALKSFESIRLQRRELIEFIHAIDTSPLSFALGLTLVLSATLIGTIYFLVA